MAGNGDASANIENIKLRPASDDDWATIRAWLRRPDIEQWLGPASASEAEVITVLGTDHALAWMIEWQGVPVGYAHAIDATIWGENLPEDLAAGTWDVDIFIAEPKARGRGIGPLALAEIRSEVFSTTLATAICVFVSVANEQAVRAYERAGFEWKRIWQDPMHGPTWLLVSERPAL